MEKKIVVIIVKRVNPAKVVDYSPDDWAEATEVTKIFHQAGIW